MQVKVEKIVTSEENDKLATGVVVNGETIPADFVIMGVGVAPATELLKDHVELEKDGGVKVDEYMRVLNVPNTVKGLYAIGSCSISKAKLLLTKNVGDIAVPPLFTGQGYARIEHWNVRLTGIYQAVLSLVLKVASNQGRALGQSIAGIPKMYKKVPVFWSARKLFFSESGTSLSRVQHQRDSNCAIAATVSVLKMSSLPAMPKNSR